MMMVRKCGPGVTARSYTDTGLPPSTTYATRGWRSNAAANMSTPASARSILTATVGKGKKVSGRLTNPEPVARLAPVAGLVRIGPRVGHAGQRTAVERF
jgi:hypothetical protein